MTYWWFCKSITIIYNTLFKSCQHSGSGSAVTVLSSGPFHKSTTLALKNFCPNAPFGFLNSLYTCMCPRVALLSANSKNLFHSRASSPVIFCRLQFSLIRNNLLVQPGVITPRPSDQVISAGALLLGRRILSPGVGPFTSYQSS